MASWHRGRERLRHWGCNSLSVRSLIRGTCPHSPARQSTAAPLYMYARSQTHHFLRPVQSAFLCRTRIHLTRCIFLRWMQVPYLSENLLRNLFFLHLKNTKAWAWLVYDFFAFEILSNREKLQPPLLASFEYLIRKIRAIPLHFINDIHYSTISPH
jgi:hypothetical protein